MYVILVYDIPNEDQGARISRYMFKTCKKFLTHVQKSVFEGELSSLQYLKLKKELAKFVRKDIDSVIVFHNNNAKWLKKDFLGMEIDATSQFL